MDKIKSISVKEARKLRAGTWIKMWEGEDVNNIDRTMIGLLMENDVDNKQISFLDLKDKEIYTVDYDQVIEIGYDLTSEDSGLTEDEYEDEEEKEYEDEEDDENLEEDEE